MSELVNISEAKAQLSRLVEQVQDGGRVVIARAGRPVAVLSAFSDDVGPRQLGAWRDQDVWIADDFDDRLPEELQRAFDGS